MIIIITTPFEMSNEACIVLCKMVLCQLAKDHFAKYNAGFITHFEWGCYDNDHNAYAFIEADSHQQALLAVPPFLRNKARAIKVVEFSPAGVKDDIHKRTS